MHSSDMYPGQVPRSADVRVRLALVEQAAAMLAAGEPVTLRAVASAVGASTQVVYTHFGGMPGLLLAIREEGFDRLAVRLEGLRPSADPVADIMTLASSYTANAMANPHLYLQMFTNRPGTGPPVSAGSTFAVLVAATARARAAGRFARRTEPERAALQLWAPTHGMTMLVLTGAIDLAALAENLPPMCVSAFVGHGDRPATARRSVAAGWRPPSASVSG